MGAKEIELGLYNTGMSIRRTCVRRKTIMEGKLVFETKLNGRPAYRSRSFSRLSFV